MRYEGEFDQGLRNGFGKWSEKYDGAGESYEGNYKNDKKHGLGTYRWKSGNWYQGNFSNDNRDGYGEMYWVDGTVYKGEWKNGKESGYGKIMSNGETYATFNGAKVDSDNEEQRLKNHLGTITSNIPVKNRIQVEKNEFSEGPNNSIINYNYSSMENDSPDYEYSNYNSGGDLNSSLQRRYREILSKRFPNSRSEDASSYQSPINNSMHKRSKKKYSFHIPAHLRSKSKEFLASQNRDGSKYNLEVLSQGKYSIQQNQSYSDITKRRMTHGIKQKLSPSGRIRSINQIPKPRHRDGSGFDDRSGSLPDISRESTNAISHNNSRTRLKKMYKIVNQHFGSNRELVMRAHMVSLPEIRSLSSTI